MWWTSAAAVVRPSRRRIWRRVEEKAAPMSAGRSTGVPRRRAAARFLQLCQFDRGRLDLEGHEAPADAGNDIRDARRPIHPAVFLPREAARRLFQQPQDRGHDVAFGHADAPLWYCGRCGGHFTGVCVYTRAHARTHTREFLFFRVDIKTPFFHTTLPQTSFLVPILTNVVCFIAAAGRPFQETPLRRIAAGSVHS